MILQRILTNLLLISVFYILVNDFTCTKANVENVANEKPTRLDQEKALIGKLFTNYNKKQKPAGTVPIKFALNLNQILNVKAKEQIFMLNTFLDHEWIDKRLSWDPVDNYNITILRIASERLWTPDTFIYTTADDSGFVLPQRGAYFVVESDGKIFWPNPLPQMKVRCSMSIAWFPFDEQLCTLVFGSWSMTANYLNYTLMNLDSSLAGYEENSEWSLVDYKPFRKEIIYDNWIERFAFSEIHYKILIRRKPLFVLQNYCIPALMLCTITLFSFYMPFPQESQIGISIMLTFSILKLKLSDDVPAQSDVIPLFNIYFIGCMFSSLSALLWFSIMNNIRTNKRSPYLVRVLVTKVICHLMCLKGYRKIRKKKKMFLETTDNGQRILEFEIEEGAEHAELTEKEVIDILNNFIFRLFCLYVFLLNIVLLLICPYIIKKPLQITAD